MRVWQILHFWLAFTIRLRWVWVCVELRLVLKLSIDCLHFLLRLLTFGFSLFSASVRIGSIVEIPNSAECELFQNCVIKRTISSFLWCKTWELRCMKAPETCSKNIECRTWKKDQNDAWHIYRLLKKNLPGAWITVWHLYKEATFWE